MSGYGYVAVFVKESVLGVVGRDVIYGGYCRVFRISTAPFCLYFLNYRYLLVLSRNLILNKICRSKKKHDRKLNKLMYPS
jgi:hypothetical protein